MKIVTPTVEVVNQMMFGAPDHLILQNMALVFMNEYCNKIGFAADCEFEPTKATCDLLDHVIIFEQIPSNLLAERMSKELSDTEVPRSYPVIAYDDEYTNDPVCQRIKCAWRIFLAQLEDRGYTVLPDGEHFTAATFVPYPVLVRFISRVAGVSFRSKETRDFDPETFTVWKELPDEVKEEV